MSWGSLSRCSIQLVGVHIGGLNNRESLLSEVILCHKESLTLCSRKCLNRFWIEFVLSHRVGPLTLAFIQFSADEPDWKRWLLLRLTHARAHTFSAQQRDTLAGLSRSRFLSQTLFLLAGSRAQSNSKVAFHYKKHFAPCCTHTTLIRRTGYTQALFSCFHHHVYSLHAQTHRFALVGNKCCFYSPVINRHAQTNSSHYTHIVNCPLMLLVQIILKFTTLLTSSKNVFSRNNPFIGSIMVSFWASVSLR